MFGNNRECTSFFVKIAIMKNSNIVSTLYAIVIQPDPGMSSISNLSNSTSFTPGGIGAFPMNLYLCITGLIPMAKQAF